MQYIIKEVDGSFVIEETATKQILPKKFKTKEEANQWRKKLNLGGGFDGFSPNFFIK